MGKRTDGIEENNAPVKMLKPEMMMMTKRVRPARGMTRPTKALIMPARESKSVLISAARLMALRLRGEGEGIRVINCQR